MELTTAINGRRSIRKYKAGTEVTKEQIELMIEAALMAPSWKNSETGRYYAVIGREKVDEVRNACLPPYNAGNTENAGALLVTTVVKGISGHGMDGNPVDEIGNGWGTYDLGLQNQNLMLKAHEMGLGTLIMGLRDVDKLREMLNIPEEELVVAVIAIGTPDISPDAPKRKIVEDIVKYY